MSTGDLFRRSRELFDEALQLPGEERLSFLRRAAADDEALQAEVLSLLEAEAEAGEFLAGSAIASIGGESAWLGRSIGQYRLEGVIAGGGMGVVFRARQEQPRREVALKLIRGDVISPRALRRFELEAELLGRLDHPGIARIYDAGTTDAATGRQPYFVMELIDGLPLDEYARARDLTVPDRLELLIQVCDAVNHAHQGGIVHRDLKPANILVREDGQPKILDFGVARTTDSDLKATSFRTDVGQVMGTLQYMSPEQVRGRPEELDTRSDVYSLGVLCYELLTGRLPHPLKGKSLLEAVRMLEEEEPSTLTGGDLRFPSDLETIVRKCLEKDKERRYGSPGELAADLRRFLDSEPVLARPPSAAYQMRKFARRNRGVVVTAAVGFLVLVAGLVVSVTGWTRSSRAREQAEIEAAKSRALSEFMTGILASSDPREEGPDARVIDVLDRAAETIDRTLTDQPEVAVSAHATMGMARVGLSQYDRAEEHFRAGLALLERDHAPDDPALYPLTKSLADIVLDQGRLGEADSLAGRLDAIVAHLPPDAKETIEALHLQGILHEARGDLEGAVPLVEDAYGRAYVSLGEHDETTVLLAGVLGNLLWQVDRADEARPLLEGVCGELERTLGPDHPDLLAHRNNLAIVYRELEMHEEALALNLAILETKRRVLGEGHVSTAISQHNIAFQLRLMERPAEALPHHEDAIRIVDALLDPDDTRTLAMRAAYGTSLRDVGRYDEAETVLLGCREGFARTLGEGHPRTVAVDEALAALHEAAAGGSPPSSNPVKKD